MKCIDISFDYAAVKMNAQEREVIEKGGFATAFEAILNQATNAKYPQGLSALKGKTLGRVQKALDAMIPGETILKVEEAEFDLIKEVLLDENVKFMPSQYRLVNILIANVEAAAASKCCNEGKNSCTENTGACSGETA